MHAVMPDRTGHIAWSMSNVTRFIKPRGRSCRRMMSERHSEELLTSVESDDSAICATLPCGLLIESVSSFTLRQSRHSAGALSRRLTTENIPERTPHQLVQSLIAIDDCSFHELPQTMDNDRPLGIRMRMKLISRYVDVSMPFHFGVAGAGGTGTISSNSVVSLRSGSDIVATCERTPSLSKL